MKTGWSYIKAGTITESDAWEILRSIDFEAGIEEHPESREGFEIVRSLIEDPETKFVKIKEFKGEKSIFLSRSYEDPYISRVELEVTVIPLHHRNPFTEKWYEWTKDYCYTISMRANEEYPCSTQEFYRYFYGTSTTFGYFSVFWGSEYWEHFQKYPKNENNLKYAWDFLQERQKNR